MGKMWSKIILSHEEAFSKVGNSQIQILFSKIFDELQNISEAALFVKISKGDLVEIFVSPEACNFAHDLLQKYNATKCEKPNKENLYLFLGQPDALDVLI